MITKVLIANRGEIVRRIIKACKEMGIKTVAVYSEADRDAYFLKEADETYCIGPANPIKSYLNIDSIIEVLEKSGADAVHPGYGFLSEKADFAEAVVSAGRIWIGPSPAILKSIESKCYCRELAANAGVPVIPGTIKTITDIEEIYEFSHRYGFPFVLKLDKGGGGKGIERIASEDQIKETYERLLRIGFAAFGSPECYIEKEIIKPRHIEIQFVSDGFGNCICLGERECSIQRRFQKIIEESPSPIISMVDRETLYGYTTKLVHAMEYQGAGTIEFLRSEDGHFYFMEVNARLQVEHPVTELVTGIDIVKTQLKIALGEKLEINQRDIQLKGHAIEARIYAEDPVTFVPSPGLITGLTFPNFEDKIIRVDHAMEEGGNVPPYYDPMLAKVIAWGPNRIKSINSLQKALAEFKVVGVKTTIPANLKILENEKFVEGNIFTGFLNETF